MTRKNIFDQFSTRRGTAVNDHDDWVGVGTGDNPFYASPEKYQTPKGYTVTGRCYETHPALKLPNSDLVIYGGSCIKPIVQDADVYVGFERGMHMTSRAYPWNPGHEVEFYIPDMTAPKNYDQFKKLVDWVSGELQSGQKVHCGCIGGHGRTGTMFAALCAVHGETDAISYVREHYCVKAVESAEQVEFLHKHFGVKKVKGHKENRHSSSTGYSKSSKPRTMIGSPAHRDEYFPMHTTENIWKAPRN